MKPLVLIDFDGTMANTFTDSPKGFNVTNASEYGIGRLFGNSGLKAFHDRGGLRSDAPIELVADIQRRTGQTEVPTGLATQQFIDLKLSLLKPEISVAWPTLYPGFKKFMDAISLGIIPVELGVLSSGHDDFIGRVFEVNGFNKPDILVTSDTLSKRRFPTRPRYKPHTPQLAEAHRLWLGNSGSGLQEPYVGRNHGKPNMLYVGDDPLKDGGLASEARIPYVSVPFTHPDFVPDPEKGQLGVENFVELAVVLAGNADNLRQGESFAKVLFDREDRELFPPVPDGEVYGRIMRERSFV